MGNPYYKFGKTLLIIGSRGLIGSACKRHFEKKEGVTLLCPTRAELDIESIDTTLRYFESHSIDHVICAAGLVGGIKYNLTYPADFLTKNLQMELNVFHAAEQAQVDRLIFFASSCMYPKVCKQPMAEEALLNGPLEPTSLSYALAKLSGVQMAKSYNTQYDTSRFCAVIPNSVYGPYDNFDPDTGHVMSALIARIHQAKVNEASSVTLWGTGEARREFVFADDLARGLDVLLQTKAPPVPINLGVSKDVSIKELAETITSVVGYTGKLEWDTTKPTGTLQKLLDSSKIEALGWKPQVELKEGIRLTYEWYLNNHENIECLT